MLQKSIKMVGAQHSISAQTTHCVDLFGKKLAGQGLYREERSGPYPLVRFELKTSVGGEDDYFLQVSDGAQAWTYSFIMGRPRLSRVDLRRLTRLVEKQADLDQSDSAQGGAGQGTAQGLLGLSESTALGGMAGLLRALRGSFRFDLAESEQLYSTPVWKLRGRWQEDKLAALLPDQSAAIRRGRGEVDLSRLPEHLPDHVYVWLGKDDFFPYRIEYCRNGEGLGNSRVIAAIQLFQVSFNVPLDEGVFTFDPSGLPIADRTDEYVSRISRRRQNPAAEVGR